MALILDSDSPTTQRALVPFKKPDSTTWQRRKRQKVILDEDAYLDSMSQIIERDFYPDLAKLRVQQEALAANGDLAKLQEIEQRYRIATGTPVSQSRSGTPRRASATPSISSRPPTGLRDPSLGGRLEVEGEGERGGNVSYGEEEEEEKRQLVDVQSGRPLSLDQFLAGHTSEDNASFDEIVERTNERKRERYPWLFDKEHADRAAVPLLTSGTQERGLLLLEGERGQKRRREKEEREEKEQALAVIAEEQSARTHEHEPRTFVARNALMYTPDGVPLTAEEDADLARRPPKEIKHRNTRFVATPIGTKQPEIPVEQANTWSMLEGEHELMQQRRALRELGLASRPDAAASPRVGGYGFVATPSPMIQPGGSGDGEGGATPFMTWGTIDSTPMRLSVLDDIAPPTSGPSFSMPKVSKREQVAHNLSDKASHSIRHRAVSGHRSSFGASASPVRRGPGSASPSVMRMQKKNSGSDFQLRASYASPSPHRTSGRAATPSSHDRRKTPLASPVVGNSGRPSAAASPYRPDTSSATKTPSNMRPTTPSVSAGSLTDDLLDI